MDLDQLLFDVTDLAIVILVMFALSMFIVGFYTVVHWIVVHTLDRLFGRD